MSGILGLSAFGSTRRNWRVAGFLYYGLLALQNRAQERAEIALADGGIRVAGGSGLVEEALASAGSLDGFSGIGIVSMGERIAVRGGVAVAVDGAPEGGAVRIARVIEEEAGRSGALKAAARALSSVGGAYSFVALLAGGAVAAARDPSGLKPLEIGSLGFDMGAVASESSALEVMGMEHVASLEPGEVLVLDAYGVEKMRVKPPNRRVCSFEYVYTARLDSVLDGIPVYGARVRIGEVLAEEAPADADAVIGVPETALPIAVGYSKASGIPLELGFASTGRKTRTAILRRSLERIVGVQLKLNPVEAAVEGRDIVLVDDSVVRGTTLRSVVWSLKKKGARRVHVRIGSPPLRQPCPFAGSIPEPDQLIGSSLSERQIAAVVGADSLRFLSVEGLAKALGLTPGSMCARCWGW